MAKKKTETTKKANPSKPSVFIVTDETIEIALKYINDKLENLKNHTEIFGFKDKFVIPTNEGLAILFGISVDLMKRHVRENPRFEEVHQRLISVQKEILMSGALSGAMKEKMAQFILENNHGMSTKIDQNIAARVEVSDKDVEAKAAKILSPLKKK